MLKIIALIIAVFVAGISSEVYAQEPSAQAQTLAASLDKNKYKKKEKKNISIEIYIDIKNDPAVKSPGEYSGIYETDGYRLGNCGRGLTEAQPAAVMKPSAGTINRNVILR